MMGVVLEEKKLSQDIIIKNCCSSIANKVCLETGSVVYNFNISNVDIFKLNVTTKFCFQGTFNESISLTEFMSAINKINRLLPLKVHLV